MTCRCRIFPMKSPTNAYKNLRGSMTKIQRILARVPKDVCQTDLHHLKVQSYVLLSHSAFEQYMEELVLFVSRAALKQLKEENTVCRAMVSLVASEAMQQADESISRRKIKASAARDLLGFAKSAVSNMHIDVQGNHGITSADQQKLMLPIGVDPDGEHLDVFAALNAFGVKRGAIAHKLRIKTEATKSSVLSETDEILRGLARIDADACSQLK